MRIPVAEPSIGEEEIASVKAAVESGWVSSIGEYIPRFETGFAYPVHNYFPPLAEAL